MKKEEIEGKILPRRQMTKNTNKKEPEFNLTLLPEDGGNDPVM